MAETTVFQKILLYILIALLVSISVLSIVFFVSGNREKSSAGENSAIEDIPILPDDDFSVFDGIGTLRLSTCDEEPVPFVVSLYFYYPSSDTSYYEELCVKTRTLKAVVTGYFSGYTRDQLRKKGESTIKAQLLGLLNSELVLGKIDALYFGDYLFFD